MLVSTLMLVIILACHEVTLFSTLWKVMKFDCSRIFHESQSTGKWDWHNTTTEKPNEFDSITDIIESCQCFVSSGNAGFWILQF